MQVLGTLGAPETTSSLRTAGVDQISVSSLRAELFFQEQLLAVGTCFLWRFDNQIGIVTAWHNLSGTHPESRRSLSSTGGRPDTIKVHTSTASTGIRVVITQRLYDDLGNANWLVHPDIGDQVDIAVLQLGISLPEASLAMPLNDIVEQPIAALVGADAFIVGYPKAIDELGLPIWKRASIASEPQLCNDQAGPRRLLVDSASREGMSGAPVYLRSIGSYMNDQGTFVIGAAVANKFIGVYTGRLAVRDELDAQLGIVWPASLVETIGQRGKRDTFTLTG